MQSETRTQEEKKTPRKRPPRLYACLFCDFQGICTEAEILKHIADKHESMYSPRSKKAKKQ